MISYRKTKQGVWVVCGPVAEVKVGKVAVTKKDGTTKAETIESIGKPFSAASGEGEMVYGYIKPSNQPSNGSNGNGNGHHKPSSNTGRCRECHGPIKDAPHHRAMQGYCGECAFDEFDM
jgi:hypothetical protein